MANTRSQRLVGTLGVIFVSGMLSVPAQAHPHVFVTTETTVLYENGTIVGLRHKWIFDELYSANAVEGLDKNKDGKYDREELAELAKADIEGLHEFPISPLRTGGPEDRAGCGARLLARAQRWHPVAPLHPAIRGTGAGRCQRPGFHDLRSRIFHRFRVRQGRSRALQRRSAAIVQGRCSRAGSRPIVGRGTATPVRSFRAHQYQDGRGRMRQSLKTSPMF